MYSCMYLGVENVENVTAVISMIVTCNSSDVVGYARRRSGLCNTAINRKYDNYRTEI